MPLHRLAPSHNIRTRLLLLVLLPFLSIIIVSGWYSLHKLENVVQEGMEQDIQLIARTIRLPLSHALQHGHTATLRRTVTSAFDMDQVYGVYVYDRDGKRISAIGRRAAEVQDSEAASLARLGDEQGGFEQVGGEEVFSYFMPLTDSGGSIIGLLQVTRRGSDFAQHLERFRWRALTLLVLASGLVIGVIWIGYQRALGRHIRAMDSAMQRIAKGELHTRVAADGPAEIRFLAQGINTMLDSIVASEKELSARRERELQLRSQLHQSEKLAAIGRFAAGVAHELGTPLSVADGKAQRALRSAGAAEASTLQQIRAQLQRMERIIRQLMDFARPVTPEQRRLRVADLVHASLHQVADCARQYQTRVQVEPPPEDITLLADRLRLEQALVNLLRNGIQAAPGGQVSIDWQRQGDWLALRVRDTGSGIAAEHRGQLLEPFFTTKPVGEGTGLGLAVVNAVVNEHAGRIELGNLPEGGAWFCLYLPIAPRTTDPKEHPHE